MTQLKTLEAAAYNNGYGNDRSLYVDGKGRGCGLVVTWDGEFAYFRAADFDAGNYVELTRDEAAAIANGAPVIEERPTLAVLKARADAASDAFDAACRPYFVNRWDYYRAVECGQAAPQSVHDAADAYLAATHAFYRARDGENGFLGGRGL